MARWLRDSRDGFFRVALRGAAALGFLALAAAGLSAHDLFLRLKSYFVPENTAIEVLVLNGTFDASEGAVARERVADIRMVGPSEDVRADTSAWHPHGDSTFLRLRTGEAGTYLIAAAIRPRELALAAEDFNRYLESDGLPDVLAARRVSGELNKPARERYSKHVKAILQAGDRRVGQFGKVLGHAAELVPLDNPYLLSPGGSLAVRALVDGKPVPNQVILAGGRGPQGEAFKEVSARSDAEGVARIPLATAGQWYVKFIHMVRVEGNPNLDYESKWATLTFELRPRAGSGEAEQDSAAVAAVIDRFHAALASGDSTTVMQLLLPDVAIVESGGIENRAEYQSGHLTSDIAFARAVPRERGSMRVTLAGDVAWAVSTSTSRGEYRGRAVNSAGAELMVLRRTEAGWRIAAIHWSSRPLRS